MLAIIEQIASLLATAYPKDEAVSLAWWIVEEETGLSRTQIICGHKDTTFSPHMQEIVSRLLHFEPIQYIFGHTLWCGLDIKVTPATLIPRPETAELVERINDQMTNDKLINVIDIGTGTGCIAIALKKAHPQWHVTGIDISSDAIEVAKGNAIRNHVEVEFKVVDIFDKIDETCNLQLSSYNVIVSNPPYIRESEKCSMRANVLDHEPATALFVPDDDPLIFYRRIAKLFSRTTYSSLPTPKYLFFEINETFADELACMLDDLGYSDIIITHDIYGKPRIIESRMA